MMEKIPVIDFSEFGIDNEDVSNIDENRRQQVATEVCNAIENIGFCYLKNHGISDDQVERLMDVSRGFFEQPIEVKKKFLKADEEGEYHGWIPEERLSPEKPQDYKEAFNYKPDTKNLKEFPNFEKELDNFFNKCTKLGRRILDAFSLGLNVPTHIMQDAHRLIGKPGNPTTLRTLYYPPVMDDIQDGQMRCAEHSDFGSVTLSFQTENDGDGLQVRNVNNEFVPTKHVPGTVLIYVSDLIQRWTADKFVAAKHRVAMPDEVHRHIARQSIVFFLVSDDNALIECLDNSKKYEPVTSGEYIQRRFARTME